MRAYLTLLLVLPASWNQDADPSVRPVVDEYFGHWSEAERQTFAQELDRRIDWKRWAEPDREWILSKLRYHAHSATAEAKGIREEMGAVSRFVGTPAPPVPAEFAHRAEDIAVRRLRAHIEEYVAVPPATEEQRGLMDAQWRKLSDLVLARARERLEGPYAEAAVQQVVAPALSEIKTLMETPLAGGPNRPLTNEEFTELMRAIDRRALGIPVIHITNDLTNAEAKPDAETRSVLSELYKLAAEVEAWIGWCHPKCADLWRETQRLNDDITAWRKGAMARVNESLPGDRKALEEQRARMERLQHSRPTVRGEASGAPERPLEVGDKDDSGRRSARTSGLWPWMIVAGVILLVGGAAIVLGTRRRRAM